MAPADRRLEDGTQAAAVSEPPAPPAGLPSIGSGLSARLLLLTIGFVMVAEIAIFAPTLGRFRLDYLREKLTSAHLVLTALEASRGQIDPVLRDRLLEQAGMRGMTALRPKLPPRTLGPRMPSRIPKLYDLRHDRFWNLIGDAFATMARGGSLAIGVTDVSPLDHTVVMEVVLDEEPLRDAMWDYAVRIFYLSIFISVTAAALVYASLQWLAVRPLRRLTASMVNFHKAPEDSARIIVPSNRDDEVGVAEHALAAMQGQIRASLMQKERLAGVGTAVTKISHDLKNILSTAMLETDRLESAADPEVRRVTAGIMRAVDRAVKLSASTLRFAKEGPPQVVKQPLQISAFLLELRNAVQPGLKGCDVRFGSVTDFAFMGDPDLLQRAFENLLRNAAEAGATVSELSAALENGQRLVRIADNGPGLAPRAQDNLFQPFAGSTRTGGSGLGLTIARELLRAQGGDIALQSTSPQGTTFIMRLPP